MKKVLAAIFLVTYLAFSSGVVISYHFCMNKLASTQLFGDSDNTCNLCGMESDDTGCCHDESIVLKSDEDQNTPVSFTFQFRNPVMTINLVSHFLILPFENSNELHFEATSPPPLLTKQDSYLQNRSFRI